MITLNDEYGAHGFESIERLNLAEGIVSFKRRFGGGYFTVIPISSASHRRRHPTKAFVEYSLVEGVHQFNISDDWGTIHLLRIEDGPNVRTIIEDNLQSLKDANLLKGEYETS
jgi:hypothetical protein